MQRAREALAEAPDDEYEFRTRSNKQQRSRGRNLERTIRNHNVAQAIAMQVSSALPRSALRSESMTCKPLISAGRAYRTSEQAILAEQVSEPDDGKQQDETDPDAGISTSSEVLDSTQPDVMPNQPQVDQSWQGNLRASDATESIPNARRSASNAVSLYPRKRSPSLPRDPPMSTVPPAPPGAPPAPPPFGWPPPNPPRLTFGAFRLLTILPIKYMYSELSHCRNDKDECGCRKLHCGPKLPCNRFHCKLTEYEAFSKAPPYKTVSYCWGDHNERDTVHIVDFDIEISITQNGMDVLFNLQQSTTPIVIWMDSVCINQRDDIEKAMQVGIMGHLYFCAESCVAYVGDNNTNSTELLECVYAQKDGFTPKLATRRPLVTEFLQRPWFHRLWVVQEALLSKLIILQCEQQTMNFEDFIRICHGVTADRDPSSSSKSLSPRPDYTIPELRRWYKQQQPRKSRRTKLARLKQEPPPFDPSKMPSVGTLDYRLLFNVMYATQKYGCSNASDRVFAVLSLFDGLVPDLLQPDYRADVQTVMDRVLQFLQTHEMEGVSGFPPSDIRRHVVSFFGEDET